MTPDNQLRRTPATTETHCQVKCILIQLIRLWQEKRGASQRGFLLEVRSSGGKTFYQRYVDGYGGQRQFKLGRADVLSLDQARRLGRSVLAKALLGADPQTRRQKLRSTPTLTQLVRDRYLPHAKASKRSWHTDETILRIHILRGLEYILGVRERSSKEVQEVVLNDPAPSVSLVIPRRGRRDTELEAKEVRVGGRRYIVCRNLAEAKRDTEVREAVLRHLRSALRGGDKTLVGNSAYRRYLKTPDEKHFEIDDNRVIEDARYDGLYVLRTNTTLNALAVMLRYRELLRVEDIFKTTKAILDTRPIYHKTDATIRGHVFCSFLALVVRKALDDRLAAARLKPEWGALLRELDRLQEIQTEQEGKHFILRTPVTGDVGRVFQAVGIALPPNIREAEAAAPIH